MSIRWITDALGTGPFAAAGQAPDAVVVDVRDLVDKAGNDPVVVADRIEQGVAALGRGRRVVVCCDYGMSRSNAVAAGILSVLEGTPFDASAARVLERTGETDIKVELLRTVRQVLGQAPPRARTAPYRSVLVTGATGAIGRVLAPALAGAYRLTAPDRAALDLAAGASPLDLLAGSVRADCLVHLANPRVFAANPAMGQTLTMLRNVIDVCLAQDIALVYLSSWEVFSGYRGTLLAGEGTPLLPRGPYGETKFLAETLIEHGVRQRGLRCALLRAATVYGTAAGRPKFLFHFIEKARQSRTVFTHAYRNGEAALELLHVDDLVRALLAVLRTGFLGTLNLGGGGLVATSRIAAMIRDRVGGGGDIRQRRIDDETAFVSLDRSLAGRVLRWEPEVPLEDGLSAVIAAMDKTKE